MVKAESKILKRKSNAGETPLAKKIKVEKNTSVVAATSKKESPQKNKLPLKKVKSEKGVVNKQNNEKKVQKFAGTKQLIKKEKVEKKAKNGTAEKQGESKKKRRNQYASLIQEVQLKSGTSDVELLKKIDEKIKGRTEKFEDTKTAKRKLSLLKRLRAVVDGTFDTNRAEAKKARLEAKAKANQSKQLENKKAKKQPIKQTIKQEVKQAEESDNEEDDDDAEEEEDSDLEQEEAGEEEEDSENDEDDDDEDDDEDDDSEDDEDSDGEEVEEKPKAQKPVGKPKAKGFVKNTKNNKK